tara:strand:+ start:230 stop:385 length:156 start_codon:yes stop_codon:yes gene_type:complete
MNKLELHKHKADTYDVNSEDPNTQILIKEIEMFIANGSITTTKQIDDYKQQ